MNEPADRILREWFAGYAHAGDGDWGDVVFRARRGRRRRALGLAGLATVVLAGVASAFALTRPTVDFGSAPKGPEVVVDFGRLNVISPKQLAPSVIPGEARRITTAAVHDKTFTLYVAPTDRGGFCWLWKNLGGGCRTNRTDDVATRIGGGGRVGRYGMDTLEGAFLHADAARLVVTYADGERADIPFVWVTEPIDAGFYLFDVPASHERKGREAVSLTLFDRGGSALATTEVIRGEEPDLGRGHRVPKFGPLLVPKDAVYAKRELLFDVALGPYRHMGLWVAPKRGDGGTCYWSNRSSGCVPVEGFPRPTPEFLARYPELKDAALLMGLGASGGNPVVLCCTVDEAVARVELRYQSGTRESVTPKRGYLLVVLPPEHYPPGRRLEEIVAYDASGKVVGRKPFSTDGRLYPCDDSKDVGYGVKRCP
jgi:hypothetical protein